MPLFMTKKEVFAWLKAGAKTIDVRKGAPRKGETAVFQSGASYLELTIFRKETGKLVEVITADNFRLVIPTAQTLEEAIDYLHDIYGTSEGLFTAYHLGQLKKG